MATLLCGMCMGTCVNAHGLLVALSPDRAGRTTSGHQLYGIA